MGQIPIHAINPSAQLNQEQCLLFSTLPAEIRTEIFTYALTDYDGEPFDPNTYWYRPGYTASRRTSTALLRTCKRIYFETWFMPFALTEHIFYLAADDRVPGGFDQNVNRKSLQAMQTAHGDFGIHRIRVFPQLYWLEPGDKFQRLLDTPHFRPKHVTVSIRYTDFWNWERNNRLYINSLWVNDVRLPNSVSSLSIEMETLERRKEEVDILAQAAVQGWFFRRKDEAVLTAQPADISTFKWTGSSMMSGIRWVRDENCPGKLDYHVVTVTWRLASEPESELNLVTPCPDIKVPDDLQRPPPPLSTWISLQENDMRAAGVSLDTPAEEALAAVRQFRMSSAAARARSRGVMRHSTRRS